MAEYKSILGQQWKGHSIGKLFTKFGTADRSEKVYLLLSAGFYLFSIYQNVITCWKFNKNMKKLHAYLKVIKEHLSSTIKKMDNFLSYSSKLNTYKSFNEEVKNKHKFLNTLLKNIENITPYKLHFRKINELGRILKYFYDFHTEPEHEEAMLYSFGFNGFIECIEGLSSNVNEKHVKFAKFNDKQKRKSKGKDNKKTANKFEDAYYPSLINNSPVKNSLNLDKNIIITGPNASGKTTVLKTTLINVIITQQFGCGFYESAYLKPYDHIHCYLNIPDTSGRDSLFQAEARRCKNILDDIETNGSKDTHFCVFDELYSGTNPEDAISSGNAFLKYLIKFKNVDCILTTHFIELCNKLDDNAAIENFYMKTEKTNKNFKYTYLLEKGISSVRGGVKVLDELDYPKEIIEATNYIVVDSIIF